jgi:hypothetical protein
MNTVVVIGEDGAYLRTLVHELSGRGIAARFVENESDLPAVLREAEPEIIVFDHVEPLDLYVLNPRAHGYVGTLLLLTHDTESPLAAEQLGATHVVAKTLLLRSICQQVVDLLGDLRSPP